jgi:AmiR/NasT family two-component response regulator
MRLASLVEKQMIPARVLIANRPRLIRELVIATISDQPDIEIVGEIEKEDGLMEAVEKTKPDFLIVALDKSNSLPNICQSILQDHPRIRIIAIASDRNSSMFYWTSLQIQKNQIEASEDGVLNAIRGKLLPVNRLQ